MKTRILSTILAIVMLAGIIPLSSCGKKGPEPVKSKVDHVYKATPIEAGDINVNKIGVAGGKIVVYGFEIISRDPYESQNVILSIDQATGSIDKQVLENSDENSGYIQEIALLQDGSMLFLLQGWDEKTEKSAYMVDKTTPDGKRTRVCDDIASLMESTGENSAFGGQPFYIDSMAVDKDENVFLTCDYAIIALDKNFTKLFEIEVNGYIRRLGATSDGRVYASFRDNSSGGNQICYIDTAKKGFGDPVPLPDSQNIQNAEFFVGSGFDIYYKDDSSLYGFNAADAEPTELLNFVNSDINPYTVRQLAIIDADNIVCYNYDFTSSDEVARELLLLKRVPEEEIPEKYVIRVAHSPYGSGDLDSLAVKFNRASDEYRVELVNYLKYSTEEDYSGSEQLKNDLIAGTAPDIVSLSSFNSTSDLIAQKAFTDLNKLIEKDETFDRSKYFENVLDAGCDTDGHLYELITDFQINTILANKKYLSFDHWDANKFVDFASNLPEGTYLANYTDRQTMLYLALACSMDTFIDYKNASCDFDNDNFKKLLGLVKNTEDFSYYNSLSGDELQDFREDQSLPYREGKIFLDTNGGYISSFTDYVSASVRYGDKNETVFIGYPTNKGNGAVLQASSSYAITDKSLLKEGAWNFLKTLLDADPAGRSGRRGLKTSVAGMKKVGEAEIGRWYVFSANGWSSFGGSDMTYEEALERMERRNRGGVLVQINQSHLDAFIEFLNGVQGMPDLEGKVFEIINEEAEAYFSDAKSLDETAKIIQNRVSTYIAEKS